MPRLFFRRLWANGVEPSRRSNNGIKTNAATNSTSSPEQESSYGYTPTKWICYLFVVLFSISTLAHLVQAFWFKRWFLLATAVLCGVGEIAGWAGRLWSSYDVLAGDAFMIQICCTIISPTFLVAANFIILSSIIRHLGEQYSRLSPRLYTIIFCGCDVISLIVQGTGGGIASSADDHDGTTLGANIMLGGIAFQLASIVVYTACALEFAIRYKTKRPIPGRVASPAPEFVELERNASLGSTLAQTQQPKDGEMSLSADLRKVKIMGGALAFSTVAILIRSVYRLIELADGWDGTVITTEWYFNVFDAAMIVLAIYTLNFIHPGIFLPRI